MVARASFRFAVLAACFVLAACSQQHSSFVSGRAGTPIPKTTLAAMDQIGTDRNAPILIRAFKKESEIEVWKLTHSGRYALLKTYPVCRWSGQLGPKLREGDRQVPEGFYTVTPAQMNPNSALWLAFNVGYPNAMERSLGRNGGDIMVHGTCSSRGCFAMTNEQIEEIYAVMREAFQGGQKAVQFQSYPFHMTAENLAKFRNDPNMPFWKNLKEGNDRFEVTKLEPAVGYCGAQYTFGASEAPSCAKTALSDPDKDAVIAKTKADEAKAAALIAEGTAPVRMTYADGDQHPFFKSPDKQKLREKWAASGELSRPDALATVEELELDHAGNPVPKKPKPAPNLGPAAATDSPDTPAPIVAAPIVATTPATDNSFFAKLFTTTPALAAEPSSALTPSVLVPLPPRKG